MIHHTSFSHNNKLLPPHSVFGGGRQSPLSDRPVVGRSASPPPPSAEDAAEADVAKEAEVAKAADSSAAFIGDGSISIETWCDCKVQN